MPIVSGNASAGLPLETKPFTSPAVRSVSDDCTLGFQVVSTDGGEYNKDYGCRNVLLDNPQCYCSSSRQNVNIVCKYAGRAPYIMTSVVVEAPSVGYTAPLGQGLVFCTWEEPTEAFIEATKCWDNVTTRADYNRLKALYAQEGCSNEAEEPVAFFDLSHTSRTTAFFDFPRSGRYVVVKLVRSKFSDSSNIDVQYIGFRGWTRPQAFTTAAYC